MRRALPAAWPLFVAMVSATGGAVAADPGKALVEKNCARCHAITETGASPFPEAPPFREIVKRYDPETLAEAFSEGIVVAHPAMPEFIFGPDEIGLLINYLNTLKH